MKPFWSMLCAGTLATAFSCAVQGQEFETEDVHTQDVQTEDWGQDLEKDKEWIDDEWSGSEEEAETWGEAEGFEENEWNDNFGQDYREEEITDNQQRRDAYDDFGYYDERFDWDVGEEETDDFDLWYEE